MIWQPSPDKDVALRRAEHYRRESAKRRAEIDLMMENNRRRRMNRDERIILGLFAVAVIAVVVAGWLS